MLKTKKILIISSVLLIIALILFGIYFFAFRENSTNPGTTNPKGNAVDDGAKNQNNAATQNEKVFAVSDEAVIAPIITDDGEHIKYYSRSNGNVHEILLRGDSKRTISATELSGLENILWAPTKDKVISTFDRWDQKEKYFYDYNTQSSKKLGSNMNSITWSNLGDKIIYKYTSPTSTNRVLSIADPDGSNWKNIADLSWQDVSIAPIPQSSLISIWNAPNSFEQTTLKTIGITGGDAKTIFSYRFGADYLWSPDGGRALISSSEEKGSSKITLATINSKGGEYQNLNIPTLIQKSVWSKDNKTVYYALPGAIPEGSVMPNDYINKKFNTNDTFWKVDVTTGKQERLVTLEEIKGNYDASNIFLSPSEGIFFFINRIDGKIYGIEI